MMATTADNQATALRLAKAGFAVFPCQSGGDKAKQPMPFIKWREASTTVESQILQWWRKWPDAAIGLDLAKSGLVVIDADRHGEHDGVSAFGDLMSSQGYEPHGVPLAATPNEGTHFFYRQPAGKQLGNSPGQLPAGVDVRGHGGYVVAPGTVMQDGRLYEVFGDIAEAVEMPAWLVTLIEAKRGGDQIKGTHPQPVANQGYRGDDQRNGTQPTTGSEIEELLSYIPADCGYHDWLSVLMSIHAETSGGGFAIADAWSARGGAKYPGSKELEKKWRSFKSSGVTGRTLAQLARENGADLSAIAAKYNHPESDFDPVEAATAARRLIENHDGTMADAETGEIVEPVVSAPAPANVDFPPGLVGDIARWIVATSRRPQPELAIGAALAIVGTAAGRHIQGPEKGGTALYVLALAPTGKGKDTPLRACMRILTASGMGQHLGPDQWMSMSAIVQMVVRKPLALCPQDEFGSFMQRVFSKKGSTHERAIPQILRALWGVNFGPWTTPQWANGSEHIVDAPCISIYGTSTHEQFYSAMAGAAVADGTLNRFLIIEGRKQPGYQEQTQDANTVPAGIVDAMKELYNRSGVIASAQRNQPDYNLATQGLLVQLPWCHDGAKKVFEAFRAEMDREADAKPLTADFIVRAPEMAVRIATIIAAGRRNDSVRREDIQFGIDMARNSMSYMISGADEYMTENEHEANVKRVLRLVRATGRITHSDLLRQVRSIRSRDLKDIIAALIAEGSISVDEVDTKGRKRIDYVPA